MKRVAIVVPVYQRELLSIEKISYLQLFKVLSTYDIFFVCPNNLDADYLKNNKIKRFSPQYFGGIEGYNRLMLSVEFYRAFIDYEYILIYQLDALVFCDKLLQFCDLNYDYIGAPWLSGYAQKIEDQFEFVNVGNGGFSLRNVCSCIRLLQNCEQAQSFQNNEDLFFSFHSSKMFKIAPIEIALKFSFEREVRKCYEQNNNELPFGCHAWFKYDLDFWRPKIAELGYDISFLTETGNLDKISRDLYENIRSNQKFWECGNIPDCSLIENRVIFIWGSGMYGKHTLAILENSGVKVYGFIDNDKDKAGKDVNGYNIFLPDILEKINRTVIIISISGDGGKIVRDQLDIKGKKYMEDYIYYRDLIS